MRLAQYSALCIEESSEEEGLFLLSCPSTEVTDGDGLFAERSASASSGKVEVTDKWGVDDDMSGSVDSHSCFLLYGNRNVSEIAV